MAVVRSALRRVANRLSGSSAAPSLMCRREPEILQATPLPSLRPAAPWMPRPDPVAQLTRTFTSPAAAAAAAARTRRIPNLPGPVRGTEGTKWAGQKRFLSMDRKEPAIHRILAWLDESFGPRRQAMFVIFVGLSSFVATTIVHQRIEWVVAITGNSLNSKKSAK